MTKLKTITAAAALAIGALGFAPSAFAWDGISGGGYNYGGYGGGSYNYRGLGAYGGGRFSYGPGRFNYSGYGGYGPYRPHGINISVRGY